MLWVDGWILLRVGMWVCDVCGCGCMGDACVWQCMGDVCVGVVRGCVYVWVDG